jgi:hypothetical protein
VDRNGSQTVDALGHVNMISVDDGLDLLTNLLTLLALALVAVEKARPESHHQRKRSLEDFVRTSVFGSPAIIRRRVALMMARALKGQGVIGSVLGRLGAPLMHALKGHSRLQNILVISALTLLLGFAIVNGSIWPMLIVPGLVSGVLCVGWAAPTFYIGTIYTELMERGEEYHHVTRLGSRVYPLRRWQPGPAPLAGNCSFHPS